MCGKSVSGLKSLNTAIKNHRIRKYYRVLVSGCIDKNLHLVSFLRSEGSDNTVSVSDSPGSGYKEIITDLKVIASNESYTYAEVLLVTGRKHQIRAQMAHIGHPVLGDMKYGNGKSGIQAKRQMLHAYRLELPEEILDGLTVFAPVPDDMKELVL